MGVSSAREASWMINTDDGASRVAESFDRDLKSSPFSLKAVFALVRVSFDPIFGAMVD
jgi:hypothetical protein